MLDGAGKVRYNRRTIADEKAGTDYLIHNFSGKVRYDPEILPLSDQELAVISQAVKTGWGKLDVDRIYGRVHSGNFYYPFIFNNDGSITVTPALHIDAERTVIKTVERALNHGTSKSRKIRNFSDWTELVRDEQRGHDTNDGNGDGKFQTDRGTTSMDDNARGSFGVGHQESSGADRQNSQVAFRRNGGKATLTVNGETLNSIGKPIYDIDSVQADSVREDLALSVALMRLLSLKLQHKSLPTLI